MSDLVHYDSMAYYDDYRQALPDIAYKIPVWQVVIKNDLLRSKISRMANFTPVLPVLTNFGYSIVNQVWSCMAHSAKYGQIWS